MEGLLRQELFTDPMEKDHIYRAFLDAISDIAFLKDQRSSYLAVNKSFLHFYETREDVIIGKSDDLLLHDINEVRKVQSEDREVLDSGRSKIFEHIIKNRIYEVMKFPVELRENRTGIGGYMRDVTAVKKAQSEIARLASFPQMDPSPVIEIDVTGLVRYANRAAWKLFSDYKEIDFKEHYIEGSKGIIEQLRKNRLISLTREIHIGDTWYLQVIHHVKETGFIRIYGCDITDRKETEEALRVGENRFRSLFDNSADGILLTSTDGHILNANAAACRMLGRSEDEIRQVGRAGIVDLSDPRLTAALEQRELTGKFKSEHFHVRKDGTRFLCEVSSDTFKDRDGHMKASTIFRDITERRRVEDQIKKAAEEWRTTFDSIKDMIMILNIDYKIMRVNKALASFLSLPYVDILGNYCFDLMGWIKQSPEKCPFGKMLNSRKHEESELYVNEKSIWISTSVDPIFDSNGSITGGVYIIKNITARKKTEDELRASQQRFQAILDNSPVAISWADKDERIQYINNAHRNLFGYDLDEISTIAEWRSLTLRHVPDPENAPALRKIIDSLENPTPTISTIERTFACKDGTIRHCEIRGTSFSGNSLLIYVDLTDQKHAEKALRESENKFRDLTEKSIAGIYLIQDGVFQYVNSRFAEIHGYTIEEMVGTMGTIETILPEDFAIVQENIRKRLHGEMESIRAEFRISTKQKEIKTVEIYGTHTVYRGRPAVIGTLLDISERRETDEKMGTLLRQLESKNAELEKTSAELKASQQRIIQQEKMASIGQLAAGVAHEINNPVGFIMSNLGSMRKYTERLSQFIAAQSNALENMSGPGEDVQVVLKDLGEKKQVLKIDYILEDIENIITESLEGTERVKRIVQDLKSFSRVDEMEYKRADLNGGIESTINVVWNELKYKATVKKEYGDISSTKCNLGQLNQVFMNILVNAAQAIDQHGEISIKTSQEDGYIIVSISDNGSGICEDKLDKIFEPFYTTKEVGKGTGLGLSIAYDIVKKHKGEISVKSEIGKGTTFTISLPIVES